MLTIHLGTIIHPASSAQELLRFRWNYHVARSPESISMPNTSPDLPVWILSKESIASSVHGDDWFLIQWPCKRYTFLWISSTNIIFRGTNGKISWKAAVYGLSAWSGKFLLLVPYKRLHSSKRSTASQNRLHMPFPLVYLRELKWAGTTLSCDVMRCTCCLEND